MKASRLEYRLRFTIFAIIYILGFVAPWDAVWHLDGHGINSHAWGTLAWSMAKSGLSIGAAFNVLLAFGIVCALLGAWLRTWGTAYLGSGVVLDGGMHGNGVLTDGPFRYVRNPLYLGTWFNTLALALLMPPSGAIFTVLCVGLLTMRLILAEEAFLATRLGAPYLAYCAQVSRLLPALRPRVEASGVEPHWRNAVLAELFVWGVAVSFIAVGWRYNEVLLLQGVLVSLGVSLVARAFSPRQQTA